jgi:lysozyme
MTRALLILLTLVAACGPRLHNGAQRHAEAPQVTVSRAQFGDADPYDWQQGSPENHPVHGIDVSRYQGTIDWSTAQANGVNFAFLKATEGADHADENFPTYWAQSAVAGIPRGAYHFFYHCSSAESQARWFIANVPRDPSALPPVLDIEYTPTSPTCRGKPDPARVRAEASTFLSLIAAHYGKRPILYTTVDFFEENHLSQLSGVDFWIRSTAAHPSEVYEGARWTFLQYSGTGLVPGINHKTDLNVFAGSAKGWSAWLAARQG